VAPAEERRQDRERTFHDSLFAGEAEARYEVGRFYAVVQRSADAYWQAEASRVLSRVTHFAGAAVPLRPGLTLTR
jgi:hypothetical protein